MDGNCLECLQTDDHAPILAAGAIGGAVLRWRVSSAPLTFTRVAVGAGKTHYECPPLLAWIFTFDLAPHSTALETCWVVVGSTMTAGI